MDPNPSYGYYMYNYFWRRLLDVKLEGKDLSIDYWIESPQNVGDLETLEIQWSGSIGSYCDPDVGAWWWWIKKMCYLDDIYFGKVAFESQQYVQYRLPINERLP